MSMYHAVDELERALSQLLEDQRQLLKLMAAQKEAMRKLDVRAMEALSAEQERVRLRIGAGEGRRRQLVQLAATGLRMSVPAEGIGLSQLAAAVLDQRRRERLLGLRESLRQTALEVDQAAAITGRLAGAVLGHLNTAMRLLVAAVSDPGTYTRSGTPRLAPAGGRLGALEMVG